MIQKNWQELIKPTKLDITPSDMPNAGKVVAEPIERGFGPQDAAKLHQDRDGFRADHDHRRRQADNEAEDESRHQGGEVRGRDRGHPAGELCLDEQPIEVGTLGGDEHHRGEQDHCRGTVQPLAENAGQQHQRRQRRA